MVKIYRAENCDPSQVRLSRLVPCVVFTISEAANLRAKYSPQVHGGPLVSTLTFDSSLKDSVPCGDQGHSVWVRGGGIWVSAFASPPSSCMTLGKSFNPRCLSFPSFEIGMTLSLKNYHRIWMK